MMEQLEYLTSCPLCGAKQSAAPYLSCRDTLLSGDVFHMEQCNSCKLVYTNPRPSALNISEYYESNDYISHSDTAQSFMDTIYHLVRKVMMKKKLKLIQDLVPPGSHILDLGCGTGSFLQTLHRAGYHVRGIEPNEHARKLAQAKAFLVYHDVDDLKKSDPALSGQLIDNQVSKKNQYKSEQFPATESGKQDKGNVTGSFRCITLWHVLEHIQDFTNQLKQCHHLLEGEGYLIVAVPMHNSLDAAFYKHHWAAYDLPRHLYHFNRLSLDAAAERAGFTRLKTKALPFDSFYISLLSEKNKGTKPVAIAKFRALVIGLLSNLAAACSKRPASSQVFVFQKK